MVRIFVNQKKNNIFFSIFNEKNLKIFYNSIGFEGFESKSVSFSLIEFLINKMVSFLKDYFFNNKKYLCIFFKNRLIIFSKLSCKSIKRILFFVFLDVLNSFKDFITIFIDIFIKFNIKLDKICFLNKISHGGSKFIK